MTKSPYWYYWELIILHIAFKLIEFKNKRSREDRVRFVVITEQDYDRIFDKCGIDLGLFTTNFTKQALKIRWEITKGSE